MKLTKMLRGQSYWKRKEISDKLGLRHEDRGCTSDKTAEIQLHPQGKTRTLGKDLAQWFIEMRRLRLRIQLVFRFPLQEKERTRSGDH